MTRLGEGGQSSGSGMRRRRGRWRRRKREGEMGQEEGWPKGGKIGEGKGGRMEERGTAGLKPMIALVAAVQGAVLRSRSRRRLLLNDSGLTMVVGAGRLLLGNVVVRAAHDARNSEGLLFGPFRGALGHGLRQAEQRR